MGEGGAEDLVAIRVEYLEYEDGRSGVLGYIDSPGADFPWGDARLWTVQAVARDAGVTECLAALGGRQVSPCVSVCAFVADT